MFKGLRKLAKGIKNFGKFDDKGLGESGKAGWRGEIPFSSFQKKGKGSPGKHKLFVRFQHPSIIKAFKHYEKKDTDIKQKPGEPEIPKRIGILKRMEKKIEALERLEQTKIEYTRSNMSNPYKPSAEVEEFLAFGRWGRYKKVYEDDDLEKVEKALDKSLEELGFKIENYSDGTTMITKEDLNKRNITAMAARQAYEHYLSQGEKNFFDSDVEDPYGDGLMTDEMKAIIFEDIRNNITFEKYVEQKKLFKKVVQIKGQKVWVDPISQEWFFAKREDFGDKRKLYPKISRMKWSKAYKTSVRRTMFKQQGDLRYYDKKSRRLRSPKETYTQKLIRQHIKITKQLYPKSWRNKLYTKDNYRKLVDRAKKDRTLFKYFKK